MVFLLRAHFLYAADRLAENAAQTIEHNLFSSVKDAFSGEALRQSMKEAVESHRHWTLAWLMEETPDLVERRAAYNSREASRRLVRILETMKPGEEPMP
ncbi:hypothetical protein F5883DRAFT_647096 [Diaporthe sp. PMI_573]|nr:hypothetical protein F5883DRAFT_647096 [Diaporthaceae sp. PMI_573]